MLLGKFDIEPLLTLAAVGLMKLWLRGWTNLLLLGVDVKVFELGVRFCSKGVVETLLLLRETTALGLVVSLVPYLWNLKLLFSHIFITD